MMPSSISQQWNGSIWENSNKITSTFDANNNLITMLSQDWNGSSWVNSGKSVATYDVHNNMKAYTYQYWAGTAWINSDKGAYTYDANGNCTSEIIQMWYGLTWANSSKNSSIYDSNNNLTSSLSEIWDGTKWSKQFHTKQTYDVNGFVTMSTSGNWNDDGTILKDGDSTVTYFKTITGIRNLSSLEKGLTIAPNPFNTQTTITFLEEQKNTIVTILDILGNTIRAINFSGTQLLIEKGELDPGVYFILIVDQKNKVINSKIVLQ